MIAACATPQLASTPLRDLANLSWAFAVQRHLDTEMMAGVGREVTARVFCVLRVASSARELACLLARLRDSRILRD